jgi:bifunctional non-homologous end joining protein LigD
MAPPEGSSAAPPLLKEIRSGRAAGARLKVMTSKSEISIEGKSLTLSNLDKVFYPEAGFTKAHVIDYYRQIAPALLPHLKERPLTLKRYPNGVTGPFFYEKRCPPFRPRWLKTAAVRSEKQGRTIRFCLADDLPSLVWAANLADLELHVFLSRVRNLGRPTAVVFDLDPGPGTDAVHCAEVALWLRDDLEKHGLKGFAKTSGSKGVQVYVPLNTAVTFDRTKQFARHVAETIEEQHPGEVVSKMAKKLRKGKVFIDWVQNDDHKTTICVYSLRAKSRPTVSTPLKWTEIKNAVQTRSLHSLTFEADEVVRRVGKFGDLFEPVLKLKQKLPKAT